jgi:hypothetical protein
VKSQEISQREMQDYNERRPKQMQFWKGHNGQQSGDPAKLAKAFKTLHERETLATCIRAALHEREHGVNPSSNPTAVMQVQFSACALSLCLKSKLGKNQ